MCRKCRNALTVDCQECGLPTLLPDEDAPQFCADCKKKLGFNRVPTNPLGVETMREVIDGRLR